MERREWIKVIHARTRTSKEAFRLFKPEFSMQQRMKQKRNLLLLRNLSHVRELQLRNATTPAVVQEEDELETESEESSKQ